MAGFEWKRPRLLRADEIELRVGQYAEGKGCSLLLYKTARTDMDILDETYGPGEWECAYMEIKGTLYCAITVHGVTKSDCGTESNQEAEKGEASDAFKRAGVRWGIGRELYTAPFVWIREADFETKIVKGKRVPKDSFSVRAIKYDDARRIAGLKIINERTRKVVYVYGNLTTDKPVRDRQVAEKKLESTDDGAETRINAGFAAAVEAAENAAIVCDACGAEIDRTQAEYTYRRYGKKKLCKACQNKAAPDQYKCSACGNMVDYDCASETKKLYGRVLCMVCGTSARPADA